MVASKACQDNLPHLLAGVLYTELTTGEVREAGLGGPFAHMAHVHQLYLSTSIVVAGKRRT